MPSMEKQSRIATPLISFALVLSLISGFIAALPTQILRRKFAAKKKYPGKQIVSSATIRKNGIRTSQTIQEVDGVRRAVDIRYVLASKNEVRFAVGDYERNAPLVIDPVLSYATYLGGNGDDFGQGIGLDSQGNAYVVGTTSSNNFPTVNPFQAPNKAVSVFGGADNNAFVTKINAAGTAFIYSTYLVGGARTENAHTVVDAQGTPILQLRPSAEISRRLRVHTSLHAAADLQAR